MLPGVVPLGAPAPLPPPAAPPGGSNVIPGPWAPRIVPPPSGGGSPQPIPIPIPPFGNDSGEWEWNNIFPHDEWDFGGLFKEEIDYHITIECKWRHSSPYVNPFGSSLANVVVRGPLKGARILLNPYRPQYGDFGGFRSAIIGKDGKRLRYPNSTSAGVFWARIIRCDVLPLEQMSGFKPKTSPPPDPLAPPEERPEPAPEAPPAEPPPEEDPGEAPGYIPWVPPPTFDPDDPSTWPELPDPWEKPQEEPEAPPSEPPAPAEPSPSQPKPRIIPPDSPGAPPKIEPIPPATPERPEPDPDKAPVEFPKPILPLPDPPYAVPEFPEIPEELPKTPGVPITPSPQLPNETDKESPKIPWPAPAPAPSPSPTPDESQQDRENPQVPPPYENWEERNILRDILEKIRRAVEQIPGSLTEAVSQTIRETLTKNRRGVECKITTKNRQAILPQLDENNKRKVLDILDWEIIGQGEYSSWQRRIQPVYDKLYEGFGDFPPPSTPESYELNPQNDTPVLVLQYGSFKGDTWTATSRQICIPHPRPHAFDEVKHHYRQSGPWYAAAKLADGKRIVIFNGTEQQATAQLRRLITLTRTRTVSIVSGRQRQGSFTTLSLRAVKLYPKGRRNQARPSRMTVYRPNGKKDPRYH